MNKEVKKIFVDKAIIVGLSIIIAAIIENYSITMAIDKKVIILIILIISCTIGTYNLVRMFIDIQYIWLREIVQPQNTVLLLLENNLSKDLKKHIK